MNQLAFNAQWRSITERLCKEQIKKHRPTVKAQWRSVSQSSEEQLDIEIRVRLDADAHCKRRERRQLKQLTRKWNGRVPFHRLDNRAHQ